MTSSSRSALRAVFASWSLAECHAWLQQDIRLQLLLEEETRKWFPASNSGREVGSWYCSWRELDTHLLVASRLALGR